jgi:ATP phosphoribosyltransferase
VRDYLRRRCVHADALTLAHPVQIAPHLGRADLICDRVSTGLTLQANHLRKVATVLENHAVLIRRCCWRRASRRRRAKRAPPQRRAPLKLSPKPLASSFMTGAA